MGEPRDRAEATAPTVASDVGSSATLAASPDVGAASSPDVGAASATSGDLGERYVLGDTLGRGGMGEVRLARDERVGRDVAVKQMRAEAPGAEAVARFLREARVQGRLDHPAIVPVHDLGVDERGLPYFAMKRLAGVTLAAILDRHARGDAEALARWPRRLLLARLAEVCLAVHFAHTRGVIHRDLKPHNVMLGDFGEVYVLDWGIAKVDEERDLVGGGIERGDLDTLDSVAGGTAAGAVLGTPGYMAPEQVRGGVIDARTDVYALGCILFEILALDAAHPRGAGALAAALSAPALRPAARAPDADIPPELDDACARATAPDPAARTPSAEALHAEIQRYLDGDRDLARRKELAAGHADAAERHLAAGDAGRAAAMHEAGRALALDPANLAAQQLIGRLLLEPPAETPPEVEAAIERDRIEAGKTHFRAGAFAYIGYFLFFPGLLWIGVKSWPLVLTLGAITILNTGILFWASRRGRIEGRLVYLALLCDYTLVVGTGILISPILVLPMLAVASMMAFLTQPMMKHHLAAVVSASLAVTVPLVLEWAGVLPRTVTISGDTIVITPWATGADSVGTWIVLLGATLATLYAIAGIVLPLKFAQLAAERRNALHVWHLRHLVATATEADAASAPPTAAPAPPSPPRTGSR
jgi:serine/threonine-protein kinase